VNLTNRKCNKAAVVTTATKLENELERLHL
jgi:hypothetical protein